ncbi:MAG: hypothetical protein JW982_00335, partial [Spirochaetes bacterium]|nr:hypothetical protein [Spirochaetota bacterium]
ITCILMSSVISAQKTDIQSLIHNLDYDSLLSEYNDAENSGDSYSLLELSYGLSVSSDGKNGHGPQGTVHAEKAVRFGQMVNIQKLSPEEKISYHYYMARMYNRLIDGPSSWMKYGKSKDKNLQLVLSSDPEHIGGNILKAGDYLNMPSNMGGDEKKGLDILLNLEKKRPSDYEVLNKLAQYYLNKDNGEKAEEYLNKVIRANPAHKSAKDQLNELLVMKKNLKIRKITLKDGAKTDNKRILKKISKYEGTVYDSGNKNLITESAEEISSIKGIDIKSIPFSETEIDLQIEAQENNMIVFGALGLFHIYPDYDRDPEYDGYPAVIYMDQNFLGSGNQLMVMYAGVYLMADYTLNGVFTDRGPVVKTKVNAMVLSLGGESYEKGRVVDDFAVHSPIYTAEIEIGKEYEIGFSFFINNKIQYHIWETDEKDVDVPSNNFTYSISSPVVFTTIDKGFPSKLVFSEGISISLTPELTYKPGYETWGNRYNPEYSFEHNGNPMLKFETEAAWFSTFFERNNIGAVIKYMTGSNFYQSEKWTAGSVMMTQPEAELDGYFSGEFTFKNGLLANLSYMYSILPGTWVVFMKHDIFHDIDLKDTYQGSAFGTSFKLPYDIEFAAKLGVGWDAERNNDDYGYDFQATAMRIWFF